MADGSTIGLVATSSVLAAALTQVFSIARDWWMKGHSAKFGALHLAIALEAYADECSTLLSDSEAYEASDGSGGRPRGRLSDLPPYPDEIDWKALGLRLTTAALTFRVAIGTANAKVAGAFEYGDDDDGVQEVREAAARLGSKAATLAKDIRASHGIEPQELDAEWNVVTYLLERQAVYVQLRARQRESNQRMWDEMQAAAPVQPGAEQAGADTDPANPAISLIKR